MIVPRCGLCNHQAHPPDGCTEVYYEHRPATKALYNPVRFPCWHDTKAA